MKKQFLINFLLFSVFLCEPISNQLLAQTRTTLCGEIKDLQSPSFMVQFYSTPFQNNLDQADIKLNKNNGFVTHFDILEQQTVNVFIGTNIIKVFVKPGDSIYLKINWKDEQVNAQFFGKNASDAAWPEKQKKAFANNLESPTFSQQLLTEMGQRSASKFTEFIDSIIVVKNQYLNNNKKGLSLEFIAWQMAENRFELESIKLNYPSWFYAMRGIENKTLVVDSTFYDFLKVIPINDSKNLGSTQYRNWLKYYFLFALKKQNQSMEVMNLYVFCEKLFTGEVLNHFRLHLWSDIMQYGKATDADKLYPFVKNTMRTNPIFLALEKSYLNKNVASNFTLKSIDGKSYTLSDFKGKLVYIDFWASWCGPCIREMPAGEALKKKYADKDIVFLNISIDEDEYKWRESVQRLGINGINLIANSQQNSETIQAYKVNSIPSYFLVDKEGKFIASPAPRPSSQEIVQLIDNALSK